MTTRRWGPERIANTSLAGDQSGARVAALTGGGFVVVWKDGSSATPQVRAQRFDAQGVAVGAEILVAAASRAASGIAVTGLADGGFYVTWSEAIGPLVAYVQGNVYAADGSFVRYQPVVFPFSSADGNPAVVPLAGGAAVVWEVGGGGGALRMFSAAGAGGAIHAIPRPSLPALSVTVDPGRDWVVITWLDAIKSQIVVRAVDTDRLIWVNDQVIASKPSLLSEIEAQQITRLAEGVFAVAWVSREFFEFGQSRHALTVTFVRLFDTDSADMSALGQVALVPFSNATLTLRALVPLPAGGVVVAWEDAASGMKLQALTATGTPMGPEYRLASPGSDVQLAALPDGRLAVTWTGDGDGTDTDIHLQIVDPRNGRVYGTNAAETLYGHDLGRR